MARVKWIKLFTDLFEDEKILMLSSLQKGESMIITWLKLLCLAGKINQNGAITYGNGKPYTSFLLSKVLQKPQEEVEEFLNIFEEYDMISRKDKVITISAWSKFQNVEALESIRKCRFKKEGEGRERKKEERRDIGISEDRIREREGEGEGEGEEKEKVLEKEKVPQPIAESKKATATTEQIKTLFPSIVIDTTPTHSIEDYSSALTEYNRSDFARKSFVTLSLLDRNLPRLSLGAYADYKKHNIDTSKMCIPQSYTKEEINSVFRDVRDIDVDNWDI